MATNQDDTIIGPTEDETIKGGAGSDTIDYRGHIRNQSIEQVTSSIFCSLPPNIDRQRSTYLAIVTVIYS